MVGLILHTIVRRFQELDHHLRVLVEQCNSHQAKGAYVQEQQREISSTVSSAKSELTSMVHKHSLPQTSQTGEPAQTTAQIC